MTIEVRTTQPDEYRTASNMVATALMFPPHDDESWNRGVSSWDESTSLSAWDDDRCVGHASYFTVDTTVPGGAALPTAAVTRVGVLPTYRRRGVATSLMHTQVCQAIDHGLVLMSLRASEAVIYGRYGYGVAGEYVEAAIDPVRARPVRGGLDTGSIRMLEPDKIHTTIHDVYARCLSRRPGLITRPDSFWERYFRDAASGTKPAHVVVHVADNGDIDGFAHYAVAWNDDPGPHGGRGDVHDVFATSDAAELALWAYLFDIDLVRTWRADERPVDDIVRAAVADPRAYVTKSVDDEQWMRIVDVDAALRARAYNAAQGSVAIAVTDPLVAHGNGTWRVSADGAERTDQTPDLALDIAELSAVYLGGAAWHTLAGAGRIDVYTHGAVATADTLFASRPLPFCGSFF